MKSGGFKALLSAIESGEIATQRVALFSLGNLLNFKECRKNFQEVEQIFGSWVEKFMGNNQSVDPITQKYYVRVTKLLKEG
jgi:hypothetical protein